MAIRVPIYQQTETLRPNLRQNIDVRASPAAFGAGVAQGVQAVGQGVNEVATAAAQVQEIRDQTEAENARNRLMVAMDELKYGSPAASGSGASGSGVVATAGQTGTAGYMASSGTHALNGFDKFTKSASALALEYGRDLSPRAGKLYKKAADTLVRDAKRSALRHRASALKQFVRDEALASVDTFKRQAIENYSDPQLRDKYLAAAVGSAQKLAATEGWSRRRLKQFSDEIKSDTIRLTGLHLAQNDPVAAAEYVQARRTQMLPDQYLSTFNSIRPALGQAVARDAVSNTAPSAAEIDAAALPREARTFLSVVAGTDADNSASRAHLEPEDVAAWASAPVGRYGISRDVAERAAKELNLPANSAPAQAAAAWYVAQQTYAVQTDGGDLSADIKAGKLKEVRSALGEVFDGVRALSDKEFAERLRAAETSMPSRAASGAAGEVTFSPRVSLLLSSMPKHLADGLREVARAGVAREQSQQAAIFKAHRLSVVEDFRLRIATGDDGLSREEILSSPVLDAGDKATLINSYNSKRGDDEKARKAVAAFQAGRLAVDPYSTEGKKTVDAAFELMAPAVEPGETAALVHEMVRQTGVIPGPVLNALRVGLSSTSAEQVARAAALAASIRLVDPAALERRTGGSGVEKEAVSYRYFTETLGLAPTAAAMRMMALRDPDKRRERDALLKSDVVKKFVKKQVTEANVRDIFDPGIFGFDPALGDTPLASSAAVAEYRDMLEDALVDANGDQDLAKTQAAETFRRRYRTSAYSIRGEKTIVRLPPELTYRADENGSWGYIGEQAKAALTGAGVSASRIYLQADETTERDVGAGRPARYQLFYHDDAGVLQRHQYRFFAKAPTKEEIAAAKRAESERRRDMNREAIEATRGIMITP